MTRPLPQGWEAVETDAFVSELKRELSPGHKLKGMEVTAVAKRQSQDEVLFALPGGRLAEVHLTYNQEHDPGFPGCEIWDRYDDWYASATAKSTG